MSSFLFHGGRFLNPRLDELQEGIEVLVTDGAVREVSDTPIRSAEAHRIDLRGRTLMPGLIDAHAHITAAEVVYGLMADMPLTLLSAKASVSARAMVMRGFTTIRDAGGADWGLKSAIEQGLFLGPRMFISGAPISQTGGHGDFRKRTQHDHSCSCCSALSFVLRVADGVPEVAKAVRDELRKGADQIKIMISGGVSSLLDPLESLQFRTDEIEAAVDEARRWGTYVLAHGYTAPAIERAVRVGVRSIEHGNLIDEPTARVMAEHGAYVVPTLVTYDSLRRSGAEFGMSRVSLDKNDRVLDAGKRSLEIYRSAGVKMGFGTDLIGVLQRDQSLEFLIRAEVLSPQEIIRSATLVNAELLRQEGRLGELVSGAHADLLVVDGDPYRDLSVLQNDGARIPAIMLGGRFIKNEL